MCHLTVGKSWKFVQNRQLIWFSGGNLKVILSCSGGEDCRLIIKIRSFIVKICSWLWCHILLSEETGGWNVYVRRILKPFLSWRLNNQFSEKAVKFFRNSPGSGQTGKAVRVTGRLSLQEETTAEFCCGTWRKPSTVWPSRWSWRASTSPTSSAWPSTAPTPKSSPAVSAAGPEPPERKPHLSEMVLLPRTPEEVYSGKDNDGTQKWPTDSCWALVLPRLVD